MTSGRRTTGRLIRLAAILTTLSLWSLLPEPGRGHVAIDEQIAGLNRRIEADPREAALYLKRAELHRAHADWDAARADYRRARRLDRDMAAVDLGLGRMLLEAGRPRRARAVLTRFLEHQPDHVGALRLRAAAAFRLSDWLEAAADYSRALDSAAAAGALPDPDDYLGRARALQAAGPPHVEEAVRTLDEGLNALGLLVTLEIAAIDLEIALERHSEALARLHRIEPQYTRREAWLARRGAILEAADRRAEALAAYREAAACLESLPPGRRSGALIRGLETEIRTALERLGAGTDPPGYPASGDAP